MAISDKFLFKKQWRVYRKQVFDFELSYNRLRYNVALKGY